jgi:hypothetical protein
MKRLVALCLAMMLTGSAAAPIMTDTSWWLQDFQTCHPIQYVDGQPICKDFGDNRVVTRYPCRLTMRHYHKGLPQGRAYFYRIDGDANWDGKVDIQDLLDVLMNWGWTRIEGDWCNNADVAIGSPGDPYDDLIAYQGIGDGVVNVSDLLEVLADWGRESYGDCECPE